jgi:hypothetical protein
VPRQGRPPSASEQTETIVQTDGERLDASAAARVAANSIASGMPSSRRQIAEIIVIRRRSGAKCGSAARARSMNNRTAP